MNLLLQQNDTKQNEQINHDVKSELWEVKQNTGGALRKLNTAHDEIAEKCLQTNTTLIILAYVLWQERRVDRGYKGSRVCFSIWNDKKTADMKNFPSSCVSWTMTVYGLTEMNHVLKRFLQLTSRMVHEDSEDAIKNEFLTPEFLKRPEMKLGPHGFKMFLENYFETPDVNQRNGMKVQRQRKRRKVRTQGKSRQELTMNFFNRVDNALECGKNITDLYYEFKAEWALCPR